MCQEQKTTNYKKKFTFQYGQIYYYFDISQEHVFTADLHSNMVRFIICCFCLSRQWKCYIYIPIWLDLLCHVAYCFVKCVCYLHSNMVRFIIDYFTTSLPKQVLFTFQYGQIYYINQNAYDANVWKIYIPIWLDLLCMLIDIALILLINLHSNMVRFIIPYMSPTPVPC